MSDSNQTKLLPCEPTALLLAELEGICIAYRDAGVDLREAWQSLLAAAPSATGPETGTPETDALLARWFEAKAAAVTVAEEDEITLECVGELEALACRLERRLAALTPSPSAGEAGMGRACGAETNNGPAAAIERQLGSDEFTQRAAGGNVRVSLEERDKERDAHVVNEGSIPSGSATIPEEPPQIPFDKRSPESGAWQRYADTLLSRLRSAQEEIAQWKRELAVTHNRGVEEYEKRVALQDELAREREAKDEMRVKVNLSKDTVAVWNMLLLCGEDEGNGVEGTAKLRAIIDGLITQRARALAAEQSLAAATARVGELTTWRTMDSAPKSGPAVEVALLVKNRRGERFAIIAHWANGGGEDQPHFGPAWFRKAGNGYVEISETPEGWAQLPALSTQQEPREDRDGDATGRDGGGK